MKHSSGILLYRDNLDVLLVHSGGLYHANDDIWSIPKGEINPGEDIFTTAKRELFEETDIILKSEAMYLGCFKQNSHKIINIFATKQDFDVNNFIINYIDISFGEDNITIPEVDKIRWFSINEALNKINKGQLQVLETLIKTIELEEKYKTPVKFRIKYDL